ncbi:GIY-YIG nuclease family protein [Pantoea sp. 1.19]|uniref:GIY-YIG nuclease family protein n=1 Tax=Pantoea sp. 1.19 TaxID=1925589 RepID=UPI001115201E|nr:GIY-YIG nuclease family protein [Pantoea sp. 1.19]
MTNFDHNMAYFAALDRHRFQHNVAQFCAAHPDFVHVTQLAEFEGVAGCYVMVLDDYCQVYVGVSNNVARRIMTHWSRTMPFDRLIYGGVDRSKLSIDAFRARDTTRLFIRASEETFDIEENIAQEFDPAFLCNRITGGRIDGGLAEVLLNPDVRKPRDLSPPQDPAPAPTPADLRPAASGARAGGWLAAALSRIRALFTA